MTPLFGNSVQEFYLEKVRKVHAERAERIAALKTRADAEKYVAEVRRKARACFHFPKTKCPLNATVTGTVDFPAYTLEKLIYYSRPNYPVTGNFYLPKKRQGKAPAILMLCGHNLEGKGCDAYQKAPRALAQAGFAVLVIDPVGQGERQQMLDTPVGAVMNPCWQHNMLGKQAILLGEWFGAWRTYDAVRGLDYLLGRPEVDTTRVGVHGTSGGGTLTTWVTAVDDRITMSAPSCYITTWLRNVENELPIDAEQMPPTALAQGLEMADFLIAAGPKPILLLGEKNDFFDPRGLDEAEAELIKIHRLLGAPGTIERFMGKGDHSLSQFLREAGARFFCKYAGLKPPKGEGNIPVSNLSEITAAPQGQVKFLPGQKFMHELLVEEAQRQTALQKPLAREAAARELSRRLHVGKVTAPYFRVARPSGEFGGSLWQSRFALETEPGRVMAVLKLFTLHDWYHIPELSPDVTLYVPHLDSGDELRWRKPDPNRALYGLDVRGVGEMTPLNGDQPAELRNFFNEYQFDYHYAGLGLMFDEPYLAGKVKDILAALALLEPVAKRVHLEANGQGCVPALLAAVLAGPRFASVTLRDCPDSWLKMIQDGYPYRTPFSYMLPDILRTLDLPMLQKLVKAKCL
ncbi:MAG: acetylxylan esterase [Victivallales bacterium]|nr:acetylxylan esterase [Victivallales bacterium]